MRLLRRILHEPLIHFLCIAVSLLVYESLVASESGVEGSQRHIVVDKQSLLNFMQFRAKTFEAGVFERRLDGMDPQQRQTLLDDYLREEILYREALAGGMEKDDYIIKQRLVQKMQYLTRGMGGLLADLTDEELKTYYQEHQQDYEVPASRTFTHVFFDSNDDVAAIDLLARFSEQRVSFSDAVKFGDRFPYHLNYIEKNQGFVASHFGRSFAEQVFAADVEYGKWLGPIQSEFGYHLVYISKGSESTIPTYEQVADVVKSDADRARIDRFQEEAIGKLIDEYSVSLADDVQPLYGEAK